MSFTCKLLETNVEEVETKLFCYGYNDVSVEALEEKLKSYPTGSWALVQTDDDTWKTATRFTWNGKEVVMESFKLVLEAVPR